MADTLLNQATRDFVAAHAADDVRRLALRGCPPGVDLPLALDQIAGRQRARTKLPQWAAIEGIVYPPHLSMEQCSSEPTAQYKARLAGQGRLMADLTGGFGVDFSYMARGFSRAVYVERQPRLCQLTSHNLGLLGVQADVVCDDGIDYLRQTDQHFDLLYLDPARRDDHGARTYGIADCTPDVLAARHLLTERADRVIVKLSPMLDWRKAVADVGAEWVSEVHVVSVGGECKELLLVMGRGSSAGADGAPLRLVCVNDEQTFETRLSATAQPVAVSGSTVKEGSFLYEPNASIMKAGCFAELAERFGVAQLAPNSHLFISAHFIDTFPGRKFVVSAVSTLNKRELKTALQGVTQANVAVRNFPLSVAELRRRLKLRDGGDVYIMATTLADRTHALLVCRKAR